MSKSGYESKLNVFLLSLGHFFSDFYHTFLPALLPVVTVKLGLSLSAAGSLIMVFFVTSSISQPVLGYFIDKHGWSWLIIWTIPISGLFICLAGIAPTFSFLTLCIALAGLSLALFHPLASALLSKASREDSKGTTMAWFIGSGNVGVAVAPAAVFAFMYYAGIEHLLWLALPGAIAGAAFYLAGLHHIPLSKTADPKITTPVQWYKSISLLKLNLVMGLRSWPQVAIPNFLTLWLTGQGHSAALAGGMLTVFLAGGAIGSVLGGFVSDRIGRKLCIIFSLALTLPALYLFLTASSISLLTYLLLFLGGASLQATLPSSIVWAQELLPANAAMASGMMLGLSFGLGGLGAALTGVMADFAGLQTALLWSLTPLVLGILITWSIPSRVSRQSAAIKTA